MELIPIAQDVVNRRFDRVRISRVLGTDIQNLTKGTFSMQCAAFIKCAFSNDVDASIRITDPVIEGVESIDDWIAHRDRVVQELCPVGAIETAHAKRAAVYLWRLDRVIRFEVAAKNDDSNDQTAENRDDQAGLARPFTPDRSTIETIIKYESHLDRRLAATMTELRKLQKERRQGLRSIDSDLTPLDSDLDAQRSTQTRQSQSVASDESIPPRVIERSSSRRIRKPSLQPIR
jgi:hypothetical protein